MLIRSQDKKVIINMVCTSGLSIAVKGDKSSYEVCSHEVGRSTMNFIGTYSTEEKAIKVLDLIYEYYSQYIKVADATTGDLKIYQFPKVFQMPQESEVE